jgi:hypothetical protein
LVALELVASAGITAVSIAVVSIAVAFTAVQPCAAGWRSASELLQWGQLELTELIAADTIPIDPATKLLQDRANTSARSNAIC